MRAGTVRQSGYRYIRIKGAGYYEHVLAWFYMTGEWPLNEIDHRRPGKEFKSDNRWSELRLATTSLNAINRLKQRGTTSRFKGVRWIQSRSKWRADIRVDGRKKFLGYFNQEEAAAEKYKVVARETYGEFVNEG